MAKWVKTNVNLDFESIGRRHNISKYLAEIIYKRKVKTHEDIDLYLNGTLDDLHDPRSMTDLIKACSLILQYISDNKKIRIIGDYDIDGVCSTYILIKGLKACGADVDAAIPHRIYDGYGLNENLIKDAYDAGKEVIVTCDNGISASEQIAYANSLGMHVIVTDHHEVPYEEDEDGNRLELLPPAEAVVDPKREGDNYPNSGICGAVVAWKLVGILLEMAALPDDHIKTLMTELLEAAAIATVGDVMELIGENRIIVKEGLRQINQTDNIGLRALIRAVEFDNKPITAHTIGFVIGPCLNATGRLDSARRALELLLCENGNEAAVIAGELKRMNDDRKDMTDVGVKAAIDDIEGSSLIDDKILVVYLPNIHESLAGIIAGRIRERFDRPTIIMTDAEDGIKGSGRSVEAYNMFEGLSEHKDLLTKFGGHKMAAGLSMDPDNLDLFRRRLNDSCTLSRAELETKISIDLAMETSEIGYNFLDELQTLEPFGNGNSKPVFGLLNLKITGLRYVGKNRKLMLVSTVNSEGCRADFKIFNEKIDVLMNAIDEKHGVGTAADLCDRICTTPVYMNILYYPSINEYQGRRSIEFYLNDYVIK